MKFILFLSLAYFALSTQRIYKIDINNFNTSVRDDKVVWVLLFANERCSTCNEFWPVYEKTSERRLDLNFGITITDEKPGNDLAIALGFQGQDLPAVIIYTERDRYLKLIDGHAITEKEFDYLLFEGTRGLKKDFDQYMKNIFEPVSDDDKNEL
jgi:thiol-disulfide isomerase/thioredoxin